MRGREVRQARHRAGLTQATVAGLADRSVRTVRNVERDAKVGARSLEAVCRALGLDPDRLPVPRVRVDRPVRRWTDEDAATMLAMWRRGEPLATIARRLGLTAAAVAARMAREAGRRDRPEPRRRQVA